MFDEKIETLEVDFERQNGKKVVNNVGEGLRSLEYYQFFS